MSSAMDGQESSKGHDFQASILRIMQDQRSFMEQQTTYLRQMSEQFSQVLSSGTPSLPSPASNPFFPDTSSSVASPPIPQQLDTPTVSPEVRKKAKKAHAATKPHSVLRRQWDDDLGWSAVLQTALKRIHEQVESWKDSLDTTLLFIALFSAIVTAFLLPTLSALVPAPGQNTDLLLQNLVDLVTQIASLNGLRTPNIDPPPAFEAATSDEISAALWYSSLIVSILCAGLSTFARFQMLDIEEVPKGQKFVEKVMRLKDREELAKWLLNPTFDALDWSIVVAIGLFMAGLLYQLWNLNASIQKPLILATGIIGTVGAGLVLLFIGFVSFHAIFYEESPFETSFSSAIRGFLRVIGTSRLFAKDDSHRSRFWKPIFHALFMRYANVEKEPASHQFFNLVSECDDASLLNRAAPVMVECFDYVDPEVTNFLEHVEPAIVQMLDPDTSDDAKLLLLGNLMRVKREKFENFEELTGVIPRILLRIQEEGADSVGDI